MIGKEGDKFPWNILNPFRGEDSKQSQQLPNGMFNMPRTVRGSSPFRALFFFTG
jgi:hypothetical protein